MEQILIARETVVKFYKQFETYIIFVAKFFLGVYMYQKIMGIGYVNEAAVPMLSTLPVLPLTMLLGLSFTLLPYTLSWLLMAVLITLQYSAVLEVAAVIFLFLLCVILFYARMATKESLLILLTILAFHLKMPYLVPLLAGMYCTLSAIIPVAIGVFIYAYIPIIQGLAVTTKTTGFNPTELLTTFTELYTSLVNSLTATQSWLFTAFIFAMVIVIVHVVSRLSIDFSKEIAIVLGCVLNIFGYIIAVLVAREDIAIGFVILFTLLCGALTELIRLFDSVLDYQRAESVQFEDEHNYYFVRVVPKVLMTKRKRVVRRIRPQPDAEDE